MPRGSAGVILPPSCMTLVIFGQWLRVYRRYCIWAYYLASDKDALLRSVLNVLVVLQRVLSWLLWRYDAFAAHVIL